MLDIELTLASFNASDVRETYLFAHFLGDHEKTVGEPTSDYLCFFGFGSGINGLPEGHPPAWANDYLCFEFPSYETMLQERRSLPAVKAQGQVMSDYIEMLSNVLRWYKDKHHIVLEIGEIRSFLRRVQTAIGSKFSDSIMDGIVREFGELMRSNSPMYRPRNAMVVYGVKADGTGYLALGGPNVEVDSSLDPRLKAFRVYDHPDYHWTLSTQLGGTQHSIGILEAMRRHHFTLTKEKQDSMISNILAKIKSIGSD